MKYILNYLSCIKSAGVAIFLCISLLLNPLVSIAKTPELDLSCEASVLMEASTGSILYAKNEHKKLRPASITKVMTLLLIFEALDQGKIKLDDMVTTSEHAASMGGSNVFLEANEQQSVDTMLKCICIASANDASVAMGEFIAGSEEAFVEKMNAKAAELGMNDTHFVNACGLDADGHLTSAYDIALMSHELTTKYPEVFQYTGIWMDRFEHVTKRGTSTFELANTNKLIKQYPYATGLKTGSTSLAKYSVSATASKDGIDLIAVVLAAKDYKVRFTDAKKLLDYGFSNVQLYEDNSNIVLPLLSVKKGDSTLLSLKKEDVFRYVETNGADLNTITSKLNLPKTITAPVKKGETIGSIDYYIDKNKIGSIPIYAANSIHELTFFICFKELLFHFVPF